MSPPEPAAQAPDLGHRPESANSGSADEPVGMMTVLGLCGSLRRDSHNAKLLEVVTQLLPDGLKMHRFDGLADVPPYDADLDIGPGPPGVERLRQAIRDAEGLVVVTPEYNHSIPGVLHNALNWVSHPVKDPPLIGKAVAVLVATRSQRLGYRALSETIRILNGYGNIVVPGPEIVISAAHQRLVREPDGTARLTDPVVHEQIRSQLAVLADLLRAGAAGSLAESLRRHVSGVWW